MTEPGGDEPFPLARFLLLSVPCGLAIGMTGAITALYSVSFGVGAGVAGVVWAVIAIGLLLVDVFGTRAVPRVDGRTLIVTAFLMFGVGVAISGVAPNLVVMAAGRVFQGAGVALYFGGSMQVILRHTPPDRVGEALGRFNAVYFAGIALGPLVGGGLSEVGSGQTGFRIAYLTCAALCVGVVLLARFCLPPLPSGRRPEVGLPQRPRARPGLRSWPPLTLGLFGEGLRGGLEFTVIPLVGDERFGLSSGQISIGMTALAIVDILSMHFGGRGADRIGRRPLLVGALALGAASCAVLPIASGLAGYVVWCALLGVPIGISWVLPAAVAVDVATEPDAGLASFRISADLGEVVGPIGAGVLFAVAGPLGAVAGVGVLVAGVAAWVARLREASVTAPAVVAPVPGLQPEAA